MMKTYSVRPGDIKRETHVIDASEKILGHVATEIAILLMGKQKAMFSRNADMGDSVMVINAEKVQVTGKKPEQKLYYSHSNYPGGFKKITYAKMMQEHPERIIIFAVDGMLPQNHLHDKMMKRLKVYTGLAPGKNKAEKPVAEKAKRSKAEIRKIAVKPAAAAKKEAKR
jgi:large subunit ribosomal protein L13